MTTFIYNPKNEPSQHSPYIHVKENFGDSHAPSKLSPQERHPHSDESPNLNFFERRQKILQTPLYEPNIESKSNTITDEQKRILELVEKQSKYVFDPERWMYDTVGFKCDTWQSKACDNFIEHRFLALSTATGPGKTALASNLVLFFLSTRPFSKVPCTAPSKYQLFDCLWAEIAKWRQKSQFLRETLKWTQTKILNRQYPENWFATARTAKLQVGNKTTESLQGLHAEHIMMLVDECTGVPDQVMNAVDGAVTTPGAFVLLMSNPTRRSGYFYKTITDKRRQVEHGGMFKVMHVPALGAKYCDPIQIKYAEKNYGKDSDFYRIKVLGLPPRSDSQQLITPEQIYDAHIRAKTTYATVSDTKEQKVKAAVESVFRQNEKNGTYQIKNRTIISCDPARYGDDPSVMLVRIGQDVVRREETRKMDTTEVSKLLFSLIVEYNADDVCIDAIGIGSGVVDQVKNFILEYNAKERISNTNNDGQQAKLLKAIVHEIHIGSTELLKEHGVDKQYYNLRSYAAWTLRDHIDMIAISFDSERLDEELAVLHYGWGTADRQIRLESKDQIKRELHRSPNDADAFMLLFYPDLLLCKPQLKYSSGSFSIGRSTVGTMDAKGKDKGKDNNDSPGTDTALKHIEQPKDINTVTHRFSRGSTFGFSSGPLGSKRYSKLSI